MHISTSANGAGLSREARLVGGSELSRCCFCNCLILYQARYVLGTLSHAIEGGWNTRGSGKSLCFTNQNFK